MNPRSIRRAIERKQRKQELKARRNQEAAVPLGETFRPEEEISLPEERFASDATVNAVHFSACEYPFGRNDSDSVPTSPEYLDVIEECAEQTAGEQTGELLEGASPQAPAAETEIAQLTLDLGCDTSTRRTLANRANAQHSTGPVTAAGKAKVRLNALKTGLTGRTVLLPSDDVAAYQAVIQYQVDRYQPATGEERSLVQALADHDWRIRRIPQLEYGIFALATRECEAEFAAEPEDCRAAFITLRAVTKYSRELDTLFRHEARLCRMRDRDEKRLLEIQSARRTAARQTAGNQPATGQVARAQASGARIPEPAIAHRSSASSQARQSTSGRGFEFRSPREVVSDGPLRRPSELIRSESTARNGEERASAPRQSR